MSSAAPSSLQQRLVEAMRLHVGGDVEAARGAYEALLAECPGQPELLHGLGTISLQTRQWEKAADYFRQAQAANPGQPRHLLPLARALLQSGQTERAIEALVMLLAADHAHEEGQQMLHDLLLPDAKAHGMKGSGIDRLIAAHPDVMGLRSVAIRLCRTLGEHGERLKHFEALYARGARGEAFCVEYGAMLRNAGRFEECLKLCRQWLKTWPDSENLLRLRGSMYVTLGRHKEGLADWMRVIALAPQDHEARGAAGLIKLLMSDMREGFEEYAAMRDRLIALGDLKVPLPEWNGEPLRGKRLILWSNEGIGDTVMFASLLPWVLEQGAEVTLAMFPRLAALFARSFPQVRLLEFDSQTLMKCGCDVQLAFSQLLARGLPHYTPAQHGPYLKADASRAAALREKYRALAGEKKRIGISWFTKNADSFSQRNIALAQWEALFHLPNVQLISLQYGDCAAEIADINRRFPGAILVDPQIDPYGDIDALAAQIAALDEVVSVQNTTVHLAGALGVPTTLMLSAASDWRWGLQRTDSRWYKSVIIERQEKLMEWKPVLARVAARLAGER